MYSIRFLALPVAVAATFAACSEQEPSLREQVVEHSDEFRENYGCDIPITVKIGHIVMDSPYSSGVVLGRGESGWIKIDPDIETIEEIIPGAIENSAIHETSHACNIGRRLLNSPFELPSGITMTATEGFRAHGYNNSTGEQLGFMFIEESVAALFARDMTEVKNTNIGVESGADLVQEMLDSSGLSLQELQDMQENSDLLGFMARANSIDVSELTIDNIQQIINLFSSRFDEIES